MTTIRQVVPSIPLLLVAAIALAADKPVMVSTEEGLCLVEQGRMELLATDLDTLRAEDEERRRRDAIHDRG